MDLQNSTSGATAVKINTTCDYYYSKRDSASRRQINTAMRAPIYIKDRYGTGLKTKIYR